VPKSELAIRLLTGGIDTFDFDRVNARERRKLQVFQTAHTMNKEEPT